MAPTVTNPDPGVEGLRYFHSRYLWETKQHAKLSDAQIESLKEAQKRFTDARIESLFEPWMHGKITVDVVMNQFRQLAPKRQVSLRTELVDGQAALFEANLPRRSPHQRETQVTHSAEATFGTDFKPVFGAGREQPTEN